MARGEIEGELEIHQQVVDQPGSAQVSRRHDDQIPASRGWGTKISRITDREIVWPESRSHEVGHTALLQLREFPPPRTQQADAVQECSVEARCLRTATRIQVLIAGAECQAIGLPRRWSSHNPYWQVQIRLQSFDYKKLLIVLLSKDGRIRLKDIE